MKKPVVLWVFTLFALSFFACDLQFPAAVEITGSPEIRLGAKMNISELMAESIDNMFSGFNNGNEEGFKSIICTKTSNKTYILYSIVLDQDIPVDTALTAALSNGSGSYKTPQDWDLIGGTAAPADPIEIPKINFDEFLEGFKFNNSKVYMYISGTSIVNRLTVELDIKIDLPGYSDETVTDSGRNTSSGLKGAATAYNGTDVPAGGKKLPDSIFNGLSDGADVTITPRVYIKKDETLVSSMITNPHILVEIVIWLPFTLNAEAGAEFKLPEDLFPDTDLFGREQKGDENFVSNLFESLVIDIKLTGTNPFNGANLVVKNTPPVSNPPQENITITTPFAGNSMLFEIDKTNMDKIDKSFPFSPKFSFLYPSGGTLILPRDFKVTEFAFKGKLRYRMEF